MATGLGYAYLHAAGEVVKNLNGFDVSLFYSVTPLIGVGGEFSRLTVRPPLRLG